MDKRVQNISTVTEAKHNDEIRSGEAVRGVVEKAFEQLGGYS